MYGPHRMRRVGFEVQSRLLVHPEHVDFDPTSKKLARRVVLPDLDHPVPPGWKWVADATSAHEYLPHDQAPPPHAADLFVTDHHERHAGSLGYRTLRTWQEQPRLALQLELVGDPLERLDKAQLLSDIFGLWDHTLAELLGCGVVRPWDPKKQQGIKEQVSVELPEGDTLEHLVPWAAGMWLLTSLRRQLNPRWAEMLDHLASQHVREARSPLHSDIVGNMRLLIEAVLYAPDAPDPGWVRHVLGSRALCAVLAWSAENRFSSHLVHAFVRLEREELEIVTVDDLDRLAALGIDTGFLEVMADEPRPHRYHAWRQRIAPARLRATMAPLIDLDGLTRFLRATVIGEGHTDDDHVFLPLFHPRKNVPVGTHYVEYRRIHELRIHGPDRYPHHFRRLPWAGKKKLAVQIPDHLYQLGWDLLVLGDVALAAGRHLVDRLPDLRGADIEGLYGPMLRYLLRYYNPVR